jgi:hypothetical protein
MKAVGVALVLSSLLFYISGTAQEGEPGHKAFHSHRSINDCPLPDIFHHEHLHRRQPEF